MSSVRYFHTINLAGWPYEAIYRRLGFRRTSTRVTKEQRDETEHYIRDAQELIHLQGAALRLPTHVDPVAGIVTAAGIEVKSRNLAHFLRNSREIILLAATAGPEIGQAIAKDAAGDRITRAVVLDAAASESVDAALDWIMGYLDGHLRREGKALMNTRYSAGYGDLALENQRLIYRLLGLEHLGVAITDNCILVPEKSVTAITGIAG